MTAGEALEAARHWILNQGVPIPGFGGAYVAGSAANLEQDAELPPSSDVDVFVVVDEKPAMKLGKIRHRGALLEIVYVDPVHSAEALLGDETAGPFAHAHILADPTGHLAALQATVKTDYPRRCWVQKRCAAVCARIHARLDALDASSPWHDQVTTWSFGASLTTYVLLLAGLKPPTVRKRYLAARHLLAEYGRLDFYEALLHTAGIAHMDAARVEHHLESIAAAFDAAKTRSKTPYRFASDISDLCRPIAIDGSRALIEEGFPREALFYMIATYSRCRHIFHTDAPDLLTVHDPGYNEMLADLGIASHAELQQGCERVRAFLPQVEKTAQAIIEANPAISD